MKSFRLALGVIGLAMLGLAMSLWPVLRSGLRAMPTDPGDTRLNNYLLEHGWCWLRGDAELWSPAMFHPVSGTFAYGDLLLGAAPLYWGLRAGGLEPDTAFQLWIAACLLLDYAAMWLWLARGLGLGAGAAAGGAFLFAFGSSRIAQLNHAQLLAGFFTVLALHAATRLLVPGAATARRTPVWGWIALGGACCVLQFYASFYLGWFAALGGALALLVALASRRLRPPLLGALRRHRSALAAAGGFVTLALALIATRYLAVARELGYRRFEAVASMLPRAYSWLYHGPESWLYGWQASVWPWQSLVAGRFGHEHAIGIGVITLALAVFGLCREAWNGERAGVARLALACWALLVICTSVLPSGATPWRWIYQGVPGAAAIRAVTRVSLVLLIPAALGLAFALRALRGRPWLIAAALALVILEQGRSIAFYDKQETRDLVAEIADEVRARGCRSFYYSPVLAQTGVPVGERPMRFEPVPWAHPVPYKYQVDAIWAQVLSGIPTLNGYSGTLPPDWMLTLGWNQIVGSQDVTRLREGLRRWTALHAIDFDVERCWIKRVEKDVTPPR
jgi:hypothetical protein